MTNLILNILASACLILEPITGNVKNKIWRWSIKFILVGVGLAVIWGNHFSQQKEIGELHGQVAELEETAPKIDLDGRAQFGGSVAYMSIPSKYSELISKAKQLYKEKKYTAIDPIAQELIAKKIGFGYFILGVVALNENKLDTAENNIKRAIAVGLGEKEVPYAYLNLGNIEIKRENWNKAAEYYEKTLFLDKSVEGAQKNLESIQNWKSQKLATKYNWKP